MTTLTEALPETTVAAEPAPVRQRIADGISTGKPGPGKARAAVLQPWLRAQSINVTRHAAALRPFHREEFGTDAAAPSEGHIQVVNKLISTLRRDLLKMSRNVTTSISKASAEPTSAHLQRVVIEKDNAHRWVQGIEKIWDFYFGSHCAYGVIPEYRLYKGNKKSNESIEELS